MAERQAGAVDHPRHDLELIARVAAGDGSTSDVRTAAVLREACVECRSLDADLRAIAAGTRELRDAPAPLAARDFRLTAENAARLRRRRLGGLLGGQGAARNRVMGRFGGGLVAIGLVGLVFGSGLLGGLSGLGSGSAAAPAALPASIGIQKDNASEGMILAPVQTGAAVQPAPSQGAAAAGGAQTTAGAQTPAGARDASASGSPVDPLLYISVAALVVGLGLLVAARNGRRAGL